MKWSYKLLLLLLIVTLPLSVYAGLPFTGTASVKIGYVDILKALNESNKGKDAKRTLEALSKTKAAEIDKKRKEMDKLKDEVIKQATALSEESKRSKALEMERLEREYKRVFTDSQYELSQKQMELTQGIMKDLVKIIQDIGDKESFTVILTDTTVPAMNNEGGLLLYFDKKIDITDEVIKRCNSK
jgi:outer membrane protein